MARSSLKIDTITHDEATRKNAPTAELEAFVPPEVKRPILAAYERRNPDLDPQLVWRGKDVADWSDLVVNAPPLYIQEKIHPKAIIEGLKRYKAPPRNGEGDHPKGGGGAGGGETGAGGAGPSTASRSPSPAKAGEDKYEQIDLFADFNGIDPEARTEFYAHDQHWSNRMILGDALQVMASLAEREGLKGQVQCIYIDPPYGIKFNSNFQWSTTSRDVKDGKADHFSREPEQVKAFRDTWADGIHSYLTYLRDRLTVARDLLSESGSIFVQIGDENVHRVRALMDEVFGESNFCSQIVYQKAPYATSNLLPPVYDTLLWYAKDAKAVKYRELFEDKVAEDDGAYRYTDEFLLSGGYDELEARYQSVSLVSPGEASQPQPFTFQGRSMRPPKGSHWKVTLDGLGRTERAGRVFSTANSLRYKSRLADFRISIRHNIWTDTITGSFTDSKVYVVQTNPKVVERCILMTTDPGDLVLDPTCGSGTTAYVAEQWGRRWITIDTSRVALALARARIMGARYPWYLLADSREGQMKEAEITRSVPRDTPTHGRLRQGFVYKRVPHITLKSIANNAEIDTIWEAYQEKLEPLRAALNEALGTNWEEWEVPRTLSPSPSGEGTGVGPVTGSAHPDQPHPNPASGRSVPRTDLNRLGDGSPDAPEGEGLEKARDLHAAWWSLRIARQREIDASIAAKADTEYLYDQPYVDNSRVRVAGPFTVESLSPHRVPAVDVDDSLFDELEAAEGRYKSSPERGGGSRAAADGGGPLHHSPAASGPPPRSGEERSDFAAMILDNLKKSGVQQAHKADRLVFSSIKPWPGHFVCAEGRVRQSSDPEDAAERRAAILVGPEYGTVARADLTAAAREAMEAGFDLLIAAAFNFDAHASEFDRMGALTVLQARINPDLHMPDLANTGAGNLFTVFGEPDICVHDEGDGMISIEVAGVDMYKGGQIESTSADDIAVWFIDTDYNYESFFVRHAYFPGANDPYKALKTSLKAEIDAEAWETLKRTRSRPFPRPAGGKVAVKVINHLGDEVMKVVGV